MQRQNGFTHSEGFKRVDEPSSHVFHRDESEELDG